MSAEEKLLFFVRSLIFRQPVEKYINIMAPLETNSTIFEPVFSGHSRGKAGWPLCTG